MKVIIEIDDYILDTDIDSDWVNVCNDELAESLINAIPLSDVLQEIRKRISDLYNTDVTYDNGDINTMDTPTLDKVLEYFDSEVNA